MMLYCQTYTNSKLYVNYAKKNGQTNKSRKKVENVSFKKKKKKSSLVTLTWGCYC